MDHRWSAAVHQVFRSSFARKSIAKIVLGTIKMKNTPMYICAITAFVG
jgi:hypothetical protein